eukprot:7790873-Pyramimonas_sp.AAC.1
MSGGGGGREVEEGGRCVGAPDLLWGVVVAKGVPGPRCPVPQFVAPLIMDPPWALGPISGLVA